MRQMWKAVLLSGLFASGTGPVFPQAGRTDPPSFEIAKGSVVRRDAGQVRWSTRLGPALDDPQPSHLVWDAKRVYVRHRDGVTALSTATGTILWHAPGPNDQLLVSRNLLLATAVPGDGSRWVTARTVITGAEVCKFRLPQGAITGLPRKEDWLILTPSDVIRLSGGGKTRWRTPLAEPYLFAAGGVVEVSGGDVVAFRYGRICDSGVELVRLRSRFKTPLGAGVQ
jgi:outer membrane protein assembly factor BamB